MKKTFISYSHKNEAFVEKLYTQLTRDGVICFFDKESIAWGDNWVTKLENGIDECDNVLLILSPAYCQSEWSKLERTSAIADDPAAVRKKIRPLLLEPCTDLLPRFLKPIQFLDISSDSKFEKEYPKICTELGGIVLEKTHCVDRSMLPPIGRLPDRHRMPYRSLGDGFIGRAKDIWQLDDILRESGNAAIKGVGAVMGMGGLGKTQVAIEYVHRFGLNYPGGVFWIDADRGISAMIAQLIRDSGISIDNTQDESVQLEQLWKGLSAFHRVLIVMDNFPENKPFIPWLPSESSICVLITTRRRDIGINSIDLNFMTPDEGAALINSGKRSFGNKAKDLANFLGSLPLAMELAKHYLNNIRPDISIDSLVNEIKKTGEMKALAVFAEKYADELPSRHTKEVAATFQMSFAMASPDAKLVLQAMSLLAPLPVPRKLLKAILGFSEGNLFEDRLGDAIGELDKRLSLVNLDEGNEPWLHRLILGFVRTTVDNKSKLYEEVLNAVSNEMARARDDHDTSAHNELEKIAPHANALIATEFIHVEQAIDLVSDLDWHAQKWGRYRQSEYYGRTALILAEKSFEPGHPSIARSQSNLAMVLKDLGELEEARDLLRKALASDEKSFEPGHPSIARSQSNLALVLQDLGELEEASGLAEKAYKAYLNLFGPNHPGTRTIKSNFEAITATIKDVAS